MQRAKETSAKPEESEETAHIDEMLEYKSESNRSRLKLGRKIRHQQAVKKTRQNKIDLKAKRDARKKEVTVGNEREQWQNGLVVALAEEPTEKRTQVGTKPNCGIAGAYCLATQSRSIWTIRH
jgi:hypothetical protein